MTATERASRTEEGGRGGGGPPFSSVGGDELPGVSLVAVGGYGRGELAPYSDLDVVLVHDAKADVREVAQQVWYPLWDARVDLDHSVRALPEVTAAAAADVRVAVGLLDARHLAGDTSVTLRLRTDVMARWRRDARANLPRLRELVAQRAARVGELAHAAVPDLKESTGGLRDATVLNALVASWLVDVPHADLERCRRQLLDIRDLLRSHAGRATDRVTPEAWSALAEGLDLADEQAAQRRLREVGRRTTHLSRLTWSRVDQLVAPRHRAARPRRPQLDRVAEGVAVSGGEVVLDRGADPATDPVLLLRAAAVAAERRLMLAPPSAARLARTSAPLPQPWPAEARDLLVRLLASGRGLLPVWETLDETGALETVLPEWQRIRLLPHASAVHRFTVDRHVVESCVEASKLIRRVARPDLLLVAALLHDIGKGGMQDHSVAGEPVAAAVATRMGFAPADVVTISCLVRCHLLLAETATTRDLDDPATVEAVVRRVGGLQSLDLLEVLTEADARATSPQAWTAWRASLIHELADRVRSSLLATPGTAVVGRDEPEPDPAVVAGAQDPDHVHVVAEAGEDGTRLRVTAEDRVGLMADVAATFALLRVGVRAARAWTLEGLAVSEWDVDERGLSPAVVTQRLEAVVKGSVDPAARLRSRSGTLPPSVLVHHGASDDATVLEVRTEDTHGVVFLTCRALATLDLSVRSAHVSTIGPQAVDVFYVQEPGAGALTDERAASAVHAVRRTLERASTLDA